jgi:hypothetical protein
MNTKDQALYAAAYMVDHYAASMGDEWKLKSERTGKDFPERALTLLLKVKLAAQAIQDGYALDFSKRRAIRNSCKPLQEFTDNKITDVRTMLSALLRIVEKAGLDMRWRDDAALLHQRIILLLNYYMRGSSRDVVEVRKAEPIVNLWGIDKGLVSNV